MALRQPKPASLIWLILFFPVVGLLFLIFAILGLRSLYFLLAAVVDRFYLLKYGLALILTFVGVKMLTERFFEIDIVLSLVIILGILVVSIVASMIWPRRVPVETGANTR